MGKQRLSSEWCIRNAVLHSFGVEVLSQRLHANDKEPLEESTRNLLGIRAWNLPDSWVQSLTTLFVIFRCSYVPIDRMISFEKNHQPRWSATQEPEVPRNKPWFSVSRQALSNIPEILITFKNCVLFFFLIFLWIILIRWIYVQAVQSRSPRLSLFQ